MIVVLVATMAAGAEALAEAAKIFGRIADKKLLLDVPFAGTPEMKNCCHGGCDNCDFSRIFDEMNSGRPKWIPLYTERELIDGRRHESSWGKMFAESDEILPRQAFFERLSSLEYRPALGPRVSVKADDPLDEETVRLFYDMLLGDNAGVAEGVKADDLTSGLMRLTGEEHGATWKQFSSLF